MATPGDIGSCGKGAFCPGSGAAIVPRKKEKLTYQLLNCLDSIMLAWQSSLYSCFLFQQPYRGMWALTADVRLLLIFHPPWSWSLLQPFQGMWALTAVVRLPLIFHLYLSSILQSYRGMWALTALPGRFYCTVVVYILPAYHTVPLRYTLAQLHH